jgi:hypothetical protein
MVANTVNDAIAVTTIDRDPQRCRIFCIVIESNSLEINFVTRADDLYPRMILYPRFDLPICDSREQAANFGARRSSLPCFARIFKHAGPWIIT